MDDLRTSRSSTRCWRAHGWHLVLVVVVLLGGGAALSCSRLAPGTAAGSNEIEALLTEVKAGRVRSGSRVRVSGVVTDDDADRRLAFIADVNRAIAVHTGPAGLAAVPGQRVTIDARLETSGSVT